MADKDREQDESAGFKVVDRRPFTPEGERRTDVEPETPKKETTPPQKPPAAEQRTPRPESKVAAEQPSARTAPESPREAPQPHGPVTFEGLIMSLATTAMYQLGLVQSPDQENPPVDLVGAKESIDLLDILQQKTKGNLTKEEEAMLQGSLYELRMMYVELSKRRR